MKTLFDPDAQQELLHRAEKLTAESRPVWGKMTSAQMLAHCTRGMQVPVGDLQLKPHLMRFVGRFLKNTYIHGEKQFPQNSPTAKEFVITDPCDFAKEKEGFLNVFKKLGAGKQAVVVSEHSFFGKMTPEEWGLLMYKHVSHHLQQFGL